MTRKNEEGQRLPLSGRGANSEFRLVFELEVSCREHRVPRGRVARWFQKAYDLIRKGFVGELLTLLIRQIAKGLRQHIEEQD